MKKPGCNPQYPLRGAGDFFCCGGPMVEQEAAEGMTEKGCFFSHRSCEHFPCHGIEADRFNCLFCYCPLYGADCPGTPRYLQANGVSLKDCSRCAFPHRKENYYAVLEQLRAMSRRARAKKWEK
jgi:Zn-finger protein